MKFIQIGNTHIVLTRITHFDFSPMKMTGATEIPARLTIYLDNGKVLEFFSENDEVVNAGYKTLTECFPNKL